VLTANYDQLGLCDGDTMLDLGCGFGRHAFEAARRGAVVVALDAGRDEVEGVDQMFRAMVAEGELSSELSRTATVQGDALHLPFADGTFDRVICSEVLEHIADDVGAMCELTRVLRVGGHIRIYRRSVLQSRLGSVGLRVTGHHYAHGLHSPYWWLKCLVGTTNETNVIVKSYHRLLVWDIMKKPRLTRYAEKIFSPLMGKSIVVYLAKPSTA
jgi:ubiquinone/menaquinone biosynthesis C-methylase UbiE